MVVISGVTAMTGLRRACSYLSHGGVSKVCKAVIARVRCKLFRSSRAYVLEFRSDRSSGEPPQSVEMPDGYTFRRAEPNDLGSCATLTGLSLKECRRRIASGDQCYVIMHETRAVNVSWVHFGSCYIRGMGLLMTLDDADCYLYGAYTHPDHRGKGLYGTARRVLRHWSRHRNLALVLEGNNVPLKTLSKLGYRVSQAVSHVTLFGLKMTLVEDVETKTRSRQVHWRTPVGVFWI